LGSDSRDRLADAPEGFNTRRAGVTAGRLEPFEIVRYQCVSDPSGRRCVMP
jgi:hypothetical protein